LFYFYTTNNLNRQEKTFTAKLKKEG